MTKALFETSTLADCLRRANMIAPTRGGSLTGLAGIIIKITPDAENKATVMATSGELFYMEAVNALEVSGDAVTWRVPSSMITAIVTNLPIGGTHTVSLDDQIEPNRLILKSGRSKTKLALLDVSSYPMWEPFQEEDTTVIPNLGKHIQRVKWAAGDRTGALCSVFITSEAIFSTNKFKAARILLDTGITDHVVVPNEQIVKILPRDGDVRISTSGSIFVAAPDDYTQIATTTYNEPALPIERIFQREFKYQTTFSKAQMLASLNRALAFDTGNRQGLVKLILGRGEIALVTEEQEAGMFGEMIDAHGHAETAKNHTLLLGPATLRDAINSLQSDTVTMSYSDLDDKPAVVTFIDGNYACSIALSKRDEPREESE